MSLKYIILYGMAVALIAGVLFATAREKEKISRHVMKVFAFGMAALLGYMMNFVTDDYYVMSAGDSISFIAGHGMLLSMLEYVLHFTRLENQKYRNICKGLWVIFGADAVLMIVNVFHEIYISYALYKLDGIYVTGCMPHAAYMIRLLYMYLLAIAIMTILIVRCSKIPKVYWNRYTFMIYGIVVVAVMNAIYINAIVDLRIDLSLLLYSLMAVLIYWNTFWYSKKNMLNITHRMILEHLKSPVILFDYEGMVVDFNDDAQRLFPQMERENRDCVLAQVAAEQKFPIADAAKDQSFEWKCGEITYHGELIGLKDSAGRSIGTMIALHDVTDLKNAYEELEHSILYDRLTGIYSKNSFYQQCQKYGAKKTWPVSIAISNVNDLGAMNAAYGTSYGDLVLKEMAQLISNELGNQAYVAMLDDGNVAAAFRNMDEAQVIPRMEQLKEQVSQWKMSCPVSMEYGVAVYRGGSHTVMQTIWEATESMQQKKMMNRSSAKKSLVDSLKQTIAEGDYETEAHVERTGAMAARLGKMMHLSDAQLAQLAMLTVLHDIGKIAIPDTLLSKPEKLAASEWEIMKTHTQKGYRIALAAQELAPIAECILSHHERWDGTGYPNGLHGEEIPLLSRILAVVDSHDVMTHDRPYHKAMSEQEAEEELQNCAGTQFDPEIVNNFIKMMHTKDA